MITVAVLGLGASGCGSGSGDAENDNPLADDPTDNDGNGGAPNTPEPDDPAAQPDDPVIDGEPEPVAPAEPTPSEPRDPCISANCGPGQRCEAGDAGATCIDNTCDDLACSESELCEAHEAGGFICTDNSCDDDVDCAPEEFCNTDGSCEADICSSELLRCEAESILQCNSGGSEEETLFTCGSPASFESLCVENGPDSTGCSCEDDWDCPAFTNCDVDVCKGTGVLPTCTLEPIPFTDTPPGVEIHWGGDSAASRDAHDGTAEQNPAPWPTFNQVEATPTVANLDDDNGDGLINELDFPEIIFVSHRQGDAVDAVVRAINGGGPTKGADLWANCGALVWHRDAPVDENCTAPVTRTQNPASVADLDDDGVPEVLFVDGDYGIRVLNNQGQQILVTEPGIVDGTDPGGSVAIANLDADGLPELIVGATVVRLGFDETTEELFVDTVLTGTAAQGRNSSYDAASVFAMGPTSCVADLSPDPGQEILAGTTLYRLPELAECAVPPCAAELEVVWDATVVNGTEIATEQADGYCAVADIWGADPTVPPGPDNEPDGVAEALLIADGFLLVLDSTSGSIIHQEDLGGGTQGGAPNVDDFDGDGFMEVASALSDFYVVVDLQAPTDGCPAWPDILPRLNPENNPNLDAGAIRSPGGMNPMTTLGGAMVGTCTSDADCNAEAVCNTQAGVCVCLHNGWKRQSDDASSKITSSSVFDFNGDGAAEVLYNDECDFRVFNGVDGVVLYSEPSRSRTAMENPIVADVDNDGNAEAITVLNNVTASRCDDDTGTPTGPNGVRVWGDPTDTWVSARRIWNQFAYHVTNITEDASVPLEEPRSWLEYNDRTYNTYRSQPRSFGVAPDLIIGGVSLSSPDVECGQLGDSLEIAFEVSNQGDLRVGPGVIVSFYGTWDGAESALLGVDGMPLTFTIQGSLEPGRSLIASVLFTLEAQGMNALPDSVRVEVDTGGAVDSTFGAERECDESNNDSSAPVEAGEPRPDLSIDVGAASVNCPANIATVEVTITNDGTADAEGVVIEIFAGDPASGGSSMHRETLTEPIPAMGSLTTSIDVPNFPINRTVILWGVVDPGNAIIECNEADNSDPADNAINCPGARIAR